MKVIQNEISSNVLYYILLYLVVPTPVSVKWNKKTTSRHFKAKHQQKQTNQKKKNYHFYYLKEKNSLI